MFFLVKTLHAGSSAEPLSNLVERVNPGVSNRCIRGTQSRWAQGKMGGAHRTGVATSAGEQNRRLRGWHDAYPLDNSTIDAVTAIRPECGESGPACDPNARLYDDEGFIEYLR